MLSCKYAATRAQPVLPVRASRLRARKLTTVTRAQADYVKDEGFNIAKVSFGSIASPIGLGLLTYGFGAYFNLLPGADVPAVMLIYGFPISLIGFALKYAELAPVTLKSTAEALELRETQMTDIQKQVRDDCTRYRYGDEQHLDEALNRIFLIGRPNGLPRRQCPTLIGLREEVREGSYTLVLEFTSKDMTQEQWEERQPKFQSFFGPGIIAKMEKTEQGMDVALTVDGSGSGRGSGGKDTRPEMLPPLMPGLKPRAAKD